MTQPAPPRLVLPPSARTSLERLPTFVEHGGEIACRHPADAINSRLYGFVVPADHGLLDRYCDRLFNEPSGGAYHWEALGDEVLLNFVDIPTMGSTDLEDMRLGVCREREAAIWFPVVDRARDSFAWAIPYMFVDSDLALAGGREVYGFPKQMGTLHIPVGDKAPRRLSIHTETLKVHAPESEARNHRVVRVRRPGDRPLLGPAWEHPAAALRQMMRAAGVITAPSIGHRGGGLAGFLRSLDPAPDITPELLFFGHLVEEDIPMLLLKQFRDAHQQGAACYQALVRVDMEVSLFRRGGLLPDGYRVSVAALDGEPITRELGVPAECVPRAAFWLDFDFVVHLGDILFEAHGVRR